MSILINILSTFNSKGLTAAEKRTKAFNQTLKTLGGTMVATFGARRITQFAKDSIKAFAEEDKAIRALSLNLKALGLAYDVTPIEDYIDKLQRATGVADDQLRPAFQQLANATLSLSASQDILNVALDVAAGSGKDVTQVTQALSRAYLGNKTSLGRLNVGISKADLATKSFDDILNDLSKRFKGQAAVAADTYAGKMNRLKIAADEAQEIIGGKLVQSLEILGEGRGGLTAFADELERSATYVGNIAVGMAQIVNDIESLSGGKVKLGGVLSPSGLTKLGLNLQPGAKAVLDLLQMRAEAANKADVSVTRQLVKSLGVQKKITDELNKQNKAKTEASKLDKAKSLLDLEKIQIEAALQGDLTENEKLRLQLMKAILNENADRATTLAEQLGKSQADLAKFKVEAYNFKPESPFDAWLVAIEAMRKGLSSIGAPVASIPGAPSVPGGALSVAPPMPEIIGGEGAYFITPDLANRNPTGVTQININVQGTGGLDDETKRKVVDAVVEASSYGNPTNWFRTTGQAVVAV